MRHFKQLLLVLVVFLSGCAIAITTLDTAKYPKLSKLKFKKFLVVAQLPDIESRILTEKAFIKEFAWFDIDAIPSIEIFPPIKNYSEKEIQEIIEQNNIDGVLVVGLADYWLSEFYIPEGSLSKGSVSLYGNLLSYQNYTQKYGGFSFTAPRAKFAIYLFDSRSGQLAWLGTSFTRGNGYATYKTLVKSLAMEVVRKLKEEIIIEK